MGFTTEVHSKPLHFLKKTDRVFQKEIQSFLEHTQLPLYTFQFVKPTSESFLKQKATFYWQHPGHLRSSWLILNEGWQAVFVNPKEPGSPDTARIPLLKANVKQQGPFVLEVMLDTVERIVWIVDLLSAKGQQLFESMPFNQRFELAHKVMTACIQKNPVLQSCEVRLADWRPIKDFASTIQENERCHIAFMTNEPGNRRHVWKPLQKKKEVVAPVRQKNNTNHTNQVYSFVDEIEDKTEQPVRQEIPVEEKPTPQQTQPPLNKKHTRALAYKDPKGTGPDLYLLKLIDGTQIGSLALRSMPLRMQLRKAVEAKTKVPVAIAWYEPFSKYELKSLISD